MIKKTKLFHIVVYCIVILTGAASLIFHYVKNETLGWILVTLGVINLAATLLRKNT